MKKCVYYSRFTLDADSHGGDRRTAQIHQALKDFAFDFIPACKTKPLPLYTPQAKVIAKLKSSHPFSRITNYLRRHFTYRWWHKGWYTSMAHARGIAGTWARSIGPGVKIAMVDDPIFYTPLIKKLKRCKVPIVAVCHNMESLIIGKVSYEGQRILFNKELDILTLCDLVITLSREESFLLNNLNIKTIYFPYYPTDEMVGRLLKIREDRKTGKKKDFILLGNARNIPNRHGMIKVIDAWNEYNLGRFGDKLLVAGYGTELLKDITHGDGIEFLGTLTNKELDKRLISVKACLCYQEKAAGTLTRIVEMLIAGVPVVANSHAARSYYNRKGIIEFFGLKDLEEALRKTESVVGGIPIPEPPDKSILLSKIIKIHSSGFKKI